jgi:hypothetical protein
MRGFQGQTRGEFHFDAVRGGSYQVRLGGPTGELIGYVLQLKRFKWKARVKGIIVEGTSRIDAVQKALEKLERMRA